MLFLNSSGNLECVVTINYVKYFAKFTSDVFIMRIIGTRRLDTKSKLIVFLANITLSMKYTAFL